jgi:ketosteroid isomerase-like protein
LAAKKDDPIHTVVRFNDCINSQDADGLASLMTPDHRFIDSARNQTVGRDAMRTGWQSFFDAWPVYRNEFHDAFRSGSQIIVVGRSHCSDPALDGPAIWTATVEEGLVAEWRVWEDTPQNRKAAGIGRANRISMDTG